jgi:hypothetical protein
MKNLKIDPERSVIWLMCHYPDTAEMSERVKHAVKIQKKYGIEIWLFGSVSADYPESVEKLVSKEVVAAGAAADKVRCSVDFEVKESLDTIQEIENIFAQATLRNVSTLFIISNHLHLLQVYGFSRKRTAYRGQVIFVPSRLRDWRWWYLAGRIFLIPIGFLGIGRNFPPLNLVRRTRRCG